MTAVSTVHFTADLHLGHRRVSEIRGFATIEQHDEAIAAAWRAKVAEADLVYVLGDICLGNLAAAIEQIAGLPGHKILVAGNHDACHPMHSKAIRSLPRYEPAFDAIVTSATKRIAGHHVLLSHFPYSADHTPEVRYSQWRLPDRGAWLLHGHTHSTARRTGPREVHVGLDAWGLAPVPEHVIADLITRD